MRTVLLGLAASLAAFAIPAAPAAAFDPTGPQFTAGPAGGVTIHRGVSRFDGDFRRGGRDRDRHDRRRHSRHGFDGAVWIGDREYQGDTAWRHNGFNDWWHERPSRSFPRWVASNQNCERMWWSGGGWRC